MFHLHLPHGECVLTNDGGVNFRRKTEGAQDATMQVYKRHNYQMKAPITIDKVITTLKQEAHEALAGASHQSYTFEQICSLGNYPYARMLQHPLRMLHHRCVHV